MSNQTFGDLHQPVATLDIYTSAGWKKGTAGIRTLLL